MIRKKLILMNRENKLLVFIKNQYVYLPSLSIHIVQEEIPIRHYILGSKGLNEDWCFVAQTKKSQVCFYTENNHLIPYNKQIENEYYMKQEDLSEEQIRGIMKYCYKNDALPDFFTVRELLQIFKDKTLPVSYEEELPKVLKKFPLVEKIIRDNNM